MWLLINETTVHLPSQSVSHTKFQVHSMQSLQIIVILANIPVLAFYPHYTRWYPQFLHIFPITKNIGHFPSIHCHRLPCSNDKPWENDVKNGLNPPTPSSPNSKAKLLGQQSNLLENRRDFFRPRGGSILRERCWGLRERESVYIVKKGSLR